MTEHVYRLAPASTQREKDTAFKLRQLAYVNSDVDTTADPLRDKHDDQDNSLSQLLYQDDVPVGTIRASIYSSSFGWRPIPAMDHYSQELRESFSSATPISQSSFFAIVPAGRGQHWRPKALLFRALLDVAIGHNVGWMVTIVRDRRTQRNFYAKLGFQPIASPKLYPPVNRMSVLLCTKVEDFDRWVTQQLDRSR